MLTIKIEADSKSALDEMNIEVPNGTFIMTVRDGETLLGLGTMRAFDAGYASIDNIVMKDEFNDFEMQYGLAKSMLNFMDLRSIHFAVSNNKDLAKLLETLKFKSASEVEGACDIVGDDWAYCLNLNGYFTSNC